jgi:hypothetical protein
VKCVSLGFVHFPGTNLEQTYSRDGDGFIATVAEDACNVI